MQSCTANVIHNTGWLWYVIRGDFLCKADEKLTTEYTTYHRSIVFIQYLFSDKLSTTLQYRERLKTKSNYKNWVQACFIPCGFWSGFTSPKTSPQQVFNTWLSGKQNSPNLSLLSRAKIENWQVWVSQHPKQIVIRQNKIIKIISQ